MSRPAILATRLALLEANEDLQGARSLAQGSLQAADGRDQPKGQSASTKAVLYETLARVQLKVLPSLFPNILQSCIAAPMCAAALRFLLRTFGTPSEQAGCCTK